jgi:hypothetical protein
MLWVASQDSLRMVMILEPGVWGFKVWNLDIINKYDRNRSDLSE